MTLPNLLTWFYCQPITNIIILLIIATALFLGIRRKWGRCRWWKPMLLGLLVAYIGLILYMTIANRETETISQPALTLLHSYREVLNGGNPEILRSNFMNVILFYPAGIFMMDFLPKRVFRYLRILMVLVMSIAISAGIEYIQYSYGLGNAEVDDILHNSLGALVGAFAAGMFVRE